MRIEVDPNVLVQSGKQLGSVGSQLGMLSGALGAALGSGIASGMDPAGMDFGIKYGRQAQQYANALAKATDAHNIVGYMLEATGYNYQNADAASTIGGSGPAGSVGAQPSPTAAGDAPMGPSGVVVPPPAMWAIIQTFLGPYASWPSGNSSLLRVTAAQWRNLADGMSAFDADVAALKGAVSAQDIPEGGTIIQALSDLAEGLNTLSDTAKTMAQSIDDFAGGVQDTQDAIRDLLDRLSLEGLWDTITGLFTGEADDILRDIADDVGQLLENFQSQVKGVVGLLEELTIALGAAADAFQRWIRPVLVSTFGDDVGNALADSVTVYTDFQVGLATGLINTVSGVVSLADADTWKGMAALAASVAEDPSTLPGVLANMGKEFVAWDKWSGDHPGRAAGEAAFNIGSLFVPGGALSKSGSVAKSLSYTSRLLEEGRLPRFSDVPGVGGAGRGVPTLPGAGPGMPNVPDFRAGAIPGSLTGPFSPSGINAPTNPSSGSAPAGSPSASSGVGAGGEPLSRGTGPGSGLSGSGTGSGSSSESGDAFGGGQGSGGRAPIEASSAAESPDGGTPVRGDSGSLTVGAEDRTPISASAQSAETGSGNPKAGHSAGGGLYSGTSDSGSGSGGGHRPGGSESSSDGRGFSSGSGDRPVDQTSTPDGGQSADVATASPSSTPSDSVGDGSDRRQEPAPSTTETLLVRNDGDDRAPDSSGAPHTTSPDESPTQHGQHLDTEDRPHEAGADEPPDQLPEPGGETASEAPRFNLDNPLSHMSPELRALSEQYLTYSGETVLGPFRPDDGGPSYIDVAEERGASYFSIGDRWDDFDATERLAANQHVLDVAIANRDTVLYSIDIDDIRPGSYAEAEFRYLAEHGYRRSGDRYLLPPTKEDE